MKISTLCILATFLLLPAGVHAQDPPAEYITPDYIRQAPTLPPGRDTTRAVRMTLAQAIETSMRRNLALNLARETVVQAALDHDRALGRFEPTLNGSIDHTDSRAPPLTKQEEENRGLIPVFKSDSWRLGLSQPLPTGGRLGLSFTTSIQDSTGLGTAVFSKTVRPTVSVFLSQPILQGFSLDGRVQMAELISARFSSETALEQSRLTAMNVINWTEGAYWNLVRAIKSYEVSAAALDLARKQVDLIKRQIAAGSSPGSEIIGAESALAQREYALVQADANIDQMTDVLRAFLNPPPEDWDRPILPIDTPRFLPVQVALAPAIDHALIARPEVKSAHIDLKQAALSLDVLRNARLPELDLQASYQRVGQAENFSPAVDQLVQHEGRVLGIGVSLSWAPLGVAARARIRQMESVVRGNAISREQLAINIRKDVRQAVRDIETAHRQLRAAARSRELAERTLDVEQRRFLNGLSDNFKIAQRQGELEQARKSEVDALIQHELAATELQFSMGDLLEARKVRFSVSPPGSS